MSREDRSWMSLHRCSEAYNNGVIDFLDKAFAKGAQGNEICCPCKKCFFRFWYQRDAKRWIVPESARKWVLQTVGADWRTFKCRLKKKHYKPYKNNKMRWKNRPTEVSAEHFKWLLKKWDDPKDKDRAKVNALNRAKVTNVHTCGPKSFALIRERLVCSLISNFLSLEAILVELKRDLGYLLLRNLYGLFL
ncbi:hypothetical protein Dimus_027071 [Dionaea muscipula]